VLFRSETGVFDASLSFETIIGDVSATIGRGLVRVRSGELVEMPGVLPLLELSNLQIPIGERLDIGYADFYLLGDRLMFDVLEASSPSLLILGEGGVRFTDGAIDLAFRTRGTSGIPIVSAVLEGVRNAIDVGNHLRGRGYEMMGIRLDSGDLAYLSIEARRLLDEAGFPDAKIVASNDLDERLIASLKQQGAKIAVWGVGTKLVTAYDQPALGGVYKLGAIRSRNGQWQYKIKLSEQSIKVSNPGILQVRRYSDGDQFVGDAIYDEQIGVNSSTEIIDPADPNRRKIIPSHATGEDLLVPVFRAGECVYEEPPLLDVQARTGSQLKALHPGVRRFDKPHAYPAGLEPRLFELKQRMIDDARDRVHRQPAPMSEG